MKPKGYDEDLDMLLVCRRFYYAGIEAFYGRLSFRFVTARSLLELTKKLGKDRKKCIKRITISVWAMKERKGEQRVFVIRPKSVHLLEALDDLPSLQRVRVHVFLQVGISVRSWGSSPMSVRCEIEKLVKTTCVRQADVIELQSSWWQLD